MQVQQDESNVTLLYRGILPTTTINRNRQTPPLVLDNDEQSLARDRERLSNALSRIAPNLTIVATAKRGGEEQGGPLVSDLFVLCEESRRYEDAIRGYVKTNEDDVRYSVFSIEYTMPPKPGRSGRPCVTTLAIGRVALRKVTRAFWLLLPVKIFFGLLLVYCVFLLYKLFVV